MTKENPEEKHPFSADRPIGTKQEDLLGRSKFVEALAHAISGWRGNESLVVALSGPWGSGKTSIKNLLLREIGESSNPSLTPVDFNPWQWSAQDQLFQSFFDEVGILLRRNGKEKADKKRAMRWKAYSLKLKAGGFIADGIRKVVTVVFSVLGFAGVTSTVLGTPTFKGVGFVLGVISITIIGLMNWFGEAAWKIGAYLESRVKYMEKTLPEIKKELRDDLASVPKPILVVIDDIDRLTPVQTRLLFQLIKANADFPNIIYLLLFQRDIVERSLDEPGAVKGGEFLDKIVQVWFDVPIIERTKLEKVLFAGLDLLLASNGATVKFDQNRWAGVYYNGLRSFFKTMRDVHRYQSTLSFYGGIFKNKESYEVNPIDLMGLEALRLFEPGVYSQLPGMQRYLTGDYARGLSFREPASGEAKKAAETLFSFSTEDRRDSVTALIKEMFPPIATALGGGSYSQGYADQWYRDVRVCHPNIFAKYFQLSVPEGELSQAEIDAILASSSDRDSLVRELKQLKERDLLGVALDRLEAYKEHIPPENAFAFTTAMFDIGDELPENLSSLVSMGYDMHGVRLIYWNLNRDSLKDKRISILKDAIKQTRGLYLPVMYTSLEEDKQGKPQGPDTFKAEGEDFASMKDSCLKHLANAARTGRLAQHPRMATLLHRWMAWGNPDDVRSWVKDLVSSPEGSIQFLVAFVSRASSQGMGDYLLRIHYSIHIKDIEKFIDPSDLENKIKGADQEKFSVEQQKALEAFRQALKRKAEGKPEEEWRNQD